MRIHSAKPRKWGGMVALSVLALVLAILGLVLVQGDVKAAGTFNPTVGVELSDYDSEANADITTSFAVPGTDYNYKVLVSFTPMEFFVETPDVPIGAKVGTLTALATLGLVNGACNTKLEPTFDLLWASTDSSQTCTFTEQFDNSTTPGLKKGTVLYPDFVARILPGITPVQRLWGWTSVSGQLVSINFLILEAGDLPGYPADWGRPSVTILNDIGDPAAVPTPGDAITDFCTPLSSTTVNFGVSEDNSNTAADESGYELRRNPECGGAYTFRWYTSSMPDAEGDGFENYGDTCPFVDNLENFKVVTGHPDQDGIDSACDPAPTTNCWPGAPGLPLFTDCDGDGFSNRGDNCPMTANPDQADGDVDDIGDACEGAVAESGTQCNNALDDDGDTRVNDGCPADGAAETVCDEERLTCTGTPNPCDNDGDGKVNDGCPAFGYGDPNVLNGAIIDRTLEKDVEISGPSCEPSPTATATATASPTATATVVEGSPTPQGTPTATVVGEYCAPVFPGTYNGLVRINGQPAASGYEVTASIDGVQWGSALVSGGRYAMDIPDHLPTAPPCFEGGTLTFALDGMTCTPTADWASGIHNVDLSCAPAAPVTPTPPATPTATPVVTATPKVTPTTVPPTGAGGLSGSGPGLPLWALALASWAGLTIVAGLGTLLAVKRP
jgi:hypothetical protein